MLGHRPSGCVVERAQREDPLCRCSPSACENRRHRLLERRDARLEPGRIDRRAVSSRRELGRGDLGAERRDLGFQGHDPLFELGSLSLGIRGRRRVTLE